MSFKRNFLLKRFLLLTLFAAWHSPSFAQSAAIGVVKSVDGYVTLTHGQVTYAATPGSVVYEGDTLQTFWNGNVGVTFRDNTRISLGSSSRVTIRRFEFAPAENRFEFILQLLTGTMQYLSGLTAKLAPDAMKIETPSATVGVRGTRFVARAGY